MDLKKFKYVYTEIGGGWAYSYVLYAISNDNGLYKTCKFDVEHLEDASVEFVCDIPGGLNFEEHGNNVGLDAADCTMYRVQDGKLVKLYTVGMYGNIPAVEVVISSVMYEHYKKLREGNDST